MRNLQLPLLAATLVSVFFAQTVLAQEISKSQNLTNNQENRSLHQINWTATHANRRIRQLSELEPVFTSARMLLVQSPTPTSEIVQVTAVKANPTNKGVEVILQTSLGQQLQLVNRTSGNNFIADIPNAQLRLPSGDAFSFRSDKPIAGISEITVTNFDANTIRVTVTGEVSQPVVELFDSPNEGIIFSVASALSATPSQQQPQTQQPQTSQPQNQTQPTQPSTSGDEPIELVVTGEQDGYRVPDTTTATKTDTPVRDIPQSIQVVPQQVLRDQQVNTPDEALRNVPGVAISGPSRLFSGSFLIRGFSQGDDQYRNGLRDPVFNYFGFDPALIDRIEVLKGPASVLYGQGGLGGIINYVTKQPLREPFYSIEGTAGNFDFYRGALDLSGPLNQNRTVLYRLNAAAQSGGVFIDQFESQRYAIGPTITLQLSDRTKLTLDGEYLKLRQSYDSGLPALGTVLFNPLGKIPRDRFTGEPDPQIETFQTYRIGYNLEHRFSDNWQLRSAFQTSLLRLDRNYTLSVGLLSDNRSLNRFYGVYDVEDNFYNLDNYVVGKFVTGSIQHQLVFGFNLSRLDETSQGFGRAIAPLDVFEPVYGKPLGAVTGRSDIKFQSDQLGIYLQDQIALANNLKLLLGGRFDIASQTKENLLAATRNFQQDEVFSPRVGIVYQPVQPISVYASYSRSFQPAVSVYQNVFPKPERGTQYEVGIKADVSNRLSATLAFYDLTQTNLLTADPNNPLNAIPIGEQNSRGIEFDISGEILPGWNIIAGYAYTEARVTKDNSPNQGNRIDNVPYNSFNLWTTYQIQSGSLKGWGAGLGLFYSGDRQGDLDNSFEIPSYLRTDAAIFYKQDRFRAALNFKNLFDVDYFESAFGRGRVFYGAPFTVQGTISWEF